MICNLSMSINLSWKGHPPRSHLKSQRWWWIWSKLGGRHEWSEPSVHCYCIRYRGTLMDTGSWNFKHLYIMRVLPPFPVPQNCERGQLTFGYAEKMTVKSKIAAPSVLEQTTFGAIYFHAIYIKHVFKWKKIESDWKGKRTQIQWFWIEDSNFAQ